MTPKIRDEFVSSLAPYNDASVDLSVGMQVKQRNDSPLIGLILEILPNDGNESRSRVKVLWNGDADLDDMNYVRGKMSAALNIPAEYLHPSQTINRKLQ
jgi:hypothetical protein